MPYADPHDPRLRAIRNRYNSKRRKARRQKAVEAKGGLCVDCGASEGEHGGKPEPLHFHHEGEKTMELDAQAFTRSWAVLKPELEKCILLCRKCHEDKHKE